jgi:hypothetical protein
MSPYVWGMVAGIFIGGALGFFCAALLACSREDRFWKKQMKEIENDQKNKVSVLAE